MRVGVGFISAALLTSGHAVHAQGFIKSAHTVRGELTVFCRAAKRGEGRYQYRLNGKMIPKVGEECSPGDAASYISIEQQFQSPNASTLLMIEGMSAMYATIRVLRIPTTGPLLMVEGLGGDGYALVQRTPNEFRLSVPTGGFAVSDQRMSSWTCVYYINFDKRTIYGSLAVPHEEALRDSLCKTRIEAVA